MANEFVHKTVGVGMTQAEFEDILLHQFNSQATGDLPYASSATQISRLAIGATDTILSVQGGLPVWRTPANVLTDLSGQASAAFDFNSQNLTTVGTLNTHTIPGGTGTLALTTTAPAAHTIDKHTDVARTWFIPATLRDDTTYTTNYNNRPVINLPNAATNYAYGMGLVPSDFVSFTSAFVIWAGNGGSITTNWYGIISDTTYAASGESASQHGEAGSTRQAISVVALDTIYSTNFTALDIASPFASLAKGDYVGIGLERQGGHASDTYAGALKVFGFLINYTAEQ